jgi:hypothetical protein
MDLCAIKAFNKPLQSFGNVVIQLMMTRLSLDPTRTKSSQIMPNQLTDGLPMNS